MEPTAKSSQKQAINDTSFLACLPEPVLEPPRGGPAAHAAGALLARRPGRRAAAGQVLAPAYAQRWWHARALAAPQAGAFAARQGRALCCDLLVALAETGNQLTWWQKHDCTSGRVTARNSRPRRTARFTRSRTRRRRPPEPHTPVAGARLRPPPSRNTTAAWVAVAAAAQTLRACGQAGIVGNHARDRSRTPRRRGLQPLAPGAFFRGGRRASVRVSRIL